MNRRFQKKTNPLPPPPIDPTQEDNDHTMNDVNTETTPAPEEADVQAENKSRGRPRSEETRARDAAVYAKIPDVGISKTALVAALNEGVESEEDQTTGPLVYLSLYRLRKDGKVDRAQNEDGARVWKKVEFITASADPEAGITAE